MKENAIFDVFSPYQACAISYLSLGLLNVNINKPS